MAETKEKKGFKTGAYSIIACVTEGCTVLYGYCSSDR